MIMGAGASVLPRVGAVRVAVCSGAAAKSGGPVALRDGWATPGTTKHNMVGLERATLFKQVES